ncbi:non-ribosomal peptide synthetase [Shouchella lonarensis]|uniref:Amino acid adenylation domain-containing protein/thioester reductase domain-containing protein n=1 Tax=Shouchella lonarensis TaxID=1464122 RepID=A0A1G6HCF2_9BACI|nr:non-ribosomal peptide synthetase [Shouchella lonarensis]SDB91997.1 amino acid adenylation domain-containing protein/thioester reductase domain-containing protein [Shouchella lonarensis]
MSDKKALLKALLKKQGEKKVHPLSYTQQRFWLSSKMDETNAVDHISLNWRMHGAVSVKVIEKCFQTLVSRHAMLRTTFQARDGQVLQVTEPNAKVAIKRIDLAHTQNREQQAYAYVQTEAHRLFDLEKGPLFRVTMLTLDEEDHFILVNMHHIIADGWSIDVLQAEFARLYEAFSAGEAPDLQALPQQYTDFVLTQKNQWQHGDFEAQLDYWQQQLADVPVLQLPTDRPRPPVQTYNGRTKKFPLPKALVSDLKALSRKEGTTLYMTLLAAYYVLLARYSGQEDIAVGTAVANRNREELEGIIGAFVNMVVLRAKMDADMSFDSLLQHVKEVTLAAQAHQDVPFEQVVQAVQPERNAEHTPLFQVAFALETKTTPLAALDVDIDMIDVSWKTSLFDLSLMMEDHGDHLVAGLVYNVDLFNEETIDQMGQQLQVLLASIVQRPSEAVQALPLMSEQERETLLVQWNDTACPYPAEKTVPALFEEQAATRPEAIALIASKSNEVMTYRELNARANRIARFLTNEGVEQGDFVGVCMHRSFDQIASILAILKVGGAYIGLDPAYPPERLRYMMEESEMPLLFTDRHFDTTGCASTTKAVLLDQVVLPEEATNLPELMCTPTTIANVIYTSGSTGTPKGVLIPHRGIVRLVKGETWVPITPEDVYLQGASIAFDAATFEIWSSLLNGAKLVLLEAERAGVQDYADVIKQHRISTLWLTAGLFNAIVDEQVEALQGVKYLLAGGEALSVPHVKKAMNVLEGTQVINGYGPAENTACTACHWVEARDLDRVSIPIGRPIANTNVYVLDSEQQPVPIGVVGELYTGGDGVASGYLKRPDLTKERFIPHPFKKGSDEKLYRTGDLVRYLPDGSLSFIGRADHQVKIRGFRIELDEVSALLGQHPDVQAAIAHVHEDPVRGKQLIAYVVPTDQDHLQETTLRTHLQKSLPSFMVPSHIVMLHALPLSPNGKVDRKALPAPTWGTSHDNKHDNGPQTPVEEILARIWTEVLGVERVARNDHFFTCGGHSLLATKVVARVRKLFNVDLPVPQLFKTPIFADLAREIERSFGMAVEKKPLTRQPYQERMPLSFSQTSMWFFEQMYPGNRHYHMPMSWRIRGSLNVSVLEQSLKALVDRHASFRTVFTKQDDEEVVQQVVPSSFSLAVIDVRNEPDKEVHLQAERKQPFSFTTGPLFRAQLVQRATDDYELFINMHHIISDGWSMGIFIRELQALYEAFLAGKPSPLRALPLQYTDYAVWQREWLESGVLEKQMDYWREQLDGVEVLQLATDYPRPATQTFTGKTHIFTLDQKMTASLQRVSDQAGATLYMTLLAAFHILLQRYSGQEDITVGTPVAGRNEAEVENVIGFFVNTLVIRARVDGSSSFLSLLQQVKETALQAYVHQDVPFEKLVSELDAARDPSYSPLFQVLFALQNMQVDTLTLPDVTVEQVNETEETALFDLSLMMTEIENGVVGELVYNTDLFSSERIALMAHHFQVLLMEIVEQPTAAIGTLTLVSAQEREQLLTEWHETVTPSDVNGCVHTLFEAQAGRTPSAIALVDEEHALTYGTLNARANALAHRLVTEGVKAGEAVGICMGRSIEQIVSMLAILKAGGAYVCLDPAYPQERLQYMIDETAMKMILVNGDEQLHFRNVETVCVTTRVQPAEDTNDLTIQVQSKATANIIYTSGSTGAPKGVQVTHQGIVRLAKDETVVPRSSEDVYLYASSMSFDAATFEIWRSLLNGARLVIMSTARPSLQDYAHLIQTERVSVLWLTAGLFNVIVDDDAEALQGVKYLLIGGEALSTPHVKKAMHTLRGTQIINGYGPTENTVFTTCHQIKEEDLARPAIPIGRPIAGTDVYVLDEQQTPVPIGVVGELYTGGAGLAAGYLNQPELTADRFVSHPFKEGTNEKLYRTGDLVRYLPDGTLTFVGRRDDQVKIRGFRIELGEVEAILLNDARIQAAVVSVHEQEGHGKQLVAHVVPENADLDRHQLRADLKQQLPPFMVPAAIVVLQSLPLTNNGKVNRKALPAPNWETAANEEGTGAPITHTEHVLVDIWKDVLRVPHVSRHDDFFARGGHSLLATQVVSRIRKMLAIDFPLAELFRVPVLSEMAREIERSGGTTVRDEAFTPVSRDAAALPLSFAQQRMWFFDQMHEGTCHYHMPSLWRLRGAIDVACLEKSFQALIERHESLRTCFVAADGQDTVSQHIMPTTFTLPVMEVNSEHGVEAFVADDLSAPFNLATGPLVRASLLKLGEDDYRLYVNMHHIISDGWSLQLFVRELSELYAAFVTDKPSPLPALPVQYADFAVRQREWLAQGVLEAQMAYWQKQLDGVSVLQLPTDYARPSAQTFTGKTKRFQLPLALTTSLRQLSNETGTTLYMTLLAAFQALLHRYSGQEDIAIGTPVAGRNRTEVEGLIGFFVNTLVMRTHVAPSLRFSDLLTRVKETTLAAYAHQDVPFDQLVQALVVDRDAGHTPLFQVLFALQNTPNETSQLGDVDMDAITLENETALFDLSLVLEETGEALDGLFVYNTALFEEARIDRMIAHFQALLAAVVENNETSVADIVLTCAAEQHELLVTWNEATKDEPVSSADFVHTVFEKRAATTPEAIALQRENDTMTYAALNDRANGIAMLLQEQGVKVGDKVGICMSRSFDQVASMLAVLKAGAVYIGLDREYPEERLQYMIDDTHMPLLLTESDVVAKRRLRHVQLVCLDKLGIEPKMTNIATALSDNTSLANVIYTSGSTGKPKGVCITHRGIVALLTGDTYIPITSSDVLLYASSPSFDVTTFEVWGSLLNGARLVLMSEAKASLHDYERVIQKDRISTLWLTAGLFNVMVDHNVKALQGVKHLVTGGEAVSVPHIKKALEALPGTRVLNGYGPSENTVCTTIHWVEAADMARPSIPIGRPVPHTDVYVLDEEKRPVPAGVVGELYVGGIRLAAGYLNRPELTKERFIPHPFKDGAHEKVYRTGDLVRYLPDGTLLFVGRTDDQVKIRGFRIELGEVTGALLDHADVQTAVAHVHEDTSRGKQLVAYVVPKNQATFNVATLQEDLKAKLPSFMVPTAIVILSALPLSASGKVDRKALPQPDWDARLDAQDDVSPQTPVEEILATIWGDVLGVTSIRKNDHFFELGGHSLLATQVVSRIRQLLHVDFPLSRLFQVPRLADMAREIQAQMGTTVAEKTFLSVRRDEKLPLSFSQQRLWFFEQMYQHSCHYHMPSQWRLTGTVNTAILEQCFTEMIRRHESLRTTFVSADGEAVQLIHAPESFSLQVIEASCEEDVAAIIDRERTQPFNIGTGPLMRAMLIKCAPDRHELLVNMHHIISDGWSMGIFIRELCSLYEAFSAGQSSPLLPLPVQYADFSVWQRDWLEGAVMREQLAYWQQQLNGVSELQLPTDFPRPAVQTFHGETKMFTLSPELTAALRQLSRETGTTMYMTLLAAFYTFLHRYSQQDDIAVGTPVANRHHGEIEGVIGFFVNTLVMRTQVKSERTFRTLLQQVKETTLAAYAHQDVPFEKLVETLCTSRDTSFTPLFQVLFTLQNDPTDRVKMGDVTLQSVPLDNKTALFDLSLVMTAHDDQLTGGFVYNTALFTEERVARMIAHFETLLTAIVAQPDKEVGTLSLIPAAEQEQLLVEWNDTAHPYPRNHCVHTLFEEQVATSPEAIALQSVDETMTYRALNARANRIAHFLLAQGVQPGDCVGICMNRSFDQVASMLAVLKAGGAYVGLDPEHPVERLQFIVDETAMPLLLTDQPVSVAHVSIVCLNEQEMPTVETNVTVPNEATALANVIYTSGSTGKPKGVLIAHRGIARLVKGKTWVPISSNDVFLYASSISFDASTFEIWSSLLNGARLALMTASNPRLQDYAHMIQTYNVSTLWLTAGLFNVIIDHHIEALQGVKYLLVGGEALSVPHIEKAHAALHDTQIINGYGPSENTACTACHWIEAEDMTRPSIPIGRPIANTTAYVLDQNEQLAPIGVVGELYVGGDGVSLGYLNRPDLTAERFIPHPFKQGSSEKLYRTGDLVRYLPDGKLLFIGRTDHQVKIRGFRIELGEIEAVLQQHEDIDGAIVIVSENTVGDKTLTAYVAAEKGMDATTVRAHAKAHLPHYMVPTHIFTLEAFPLTTSGKVDRKALPTLCQEEREEIARPQSETEHQLLAIWQRILKRQQIGIHDNFFELGGHSLLATKLVFIMSEELGIDLTLRHLFDHPTIAGMAHILEEPSRFDAEGETLQAQFEQDCVLEPDITAPLQDAAPPSEQVKTILLTGATGFLGAYMLRDLLQTTQAVIHCVVRHKEGAAPLERIEKNLRRYDLWQPAFATRIKPVVSDLAKSRLGLNDTEWAELAAQVDVIYHNGADVNFMMPYEQSRYPNVYGTKEIIRLAVSNKVKPLHYVSTLSVFSEPSNDETLFTETSDLGSPDGLHIGYTQSKWVAEHVVAHARAQGVPISIYRPGRVSGDSVTGIVNESDFLWRLVRGCLELGMAPRMDEKIEMTPVDKMSQAIVCLSQKETVGGTYHLFNRHKIKFATIVEAMKAFHETFAEVSTEAWLAALEQDARQHETNAMAPLIHLLKEGGFSEARTAFSNDKTVVKLDQYGVDFPILTADMVAKTIAHFYKTGILKAKTTTM